MSELEVLHLDSIEKEFEEPMNFALKAISNLAPSSYFLFGSVGLRMHLPYSRIQTHFMPYSNSRFIDIDMAFSQGFPWEEIKCFCDNIKNHTEGKIIIDPHAISSDTEHITIRQKHIPHKFLSTCTIPFEESTLTDLDLKGFLLFRTVPSIRIWDIDTNFAILFELLKKEELSKDYIRFVLSNIDKTLLKRVFGHLKRVLAPDILSRIKNTLADPEDAIEPVLLQKTL